ncbi:MAG: hypothetical protein GC192_24700 [Bacteroidetes bacterium]|nr:hypothetical protein [Bacteroidota bacterium]
MDKKGVGANGLLIEGQTDGCQGRKSTYFGWRPNENEVGRKPYFGSGEIGFVGLNYNIFKGINFMSYRSSEAGRAMAETIATVSHAAFAFFSAMPFFATIFFIGSIIV